jgi:hypothetical protein
MDMSIMNKGNQKSKCFDSIRSAVFAHAIISGQDWALGNNRSYRHQDNEQFKPYPNTSPGCASNKELDF